MCRRRLKIFDILPIIIFSLLLLSSVASSKICREKYVDENIANADAILAGAVKKIEPSHSGGFYGARIEIYRIVKGREKIFNLLNLTIDDDDSQLRLKKRKNPKRLIINGHVINVNNFGSRNICESDVKPNDVRIFLLTIDSNKQLFLNSSVIQPISKELRNLNSLFENQFTDRCK